MNNLIVLEVPGRAVPIVRTTQKQKYVSASYARYSAYKQFVKWSVLSQTKAFFEKGVKLEVGIVAYLHGGGMFDLGNDPDIDNIIKGILDSLNKVLFFDDRQVMKVTGEKKRCATPGSQKVVINICEYKGE